MLYQILSFNFAQRRLQDHFIGGMFAKFRTIFFKYSETGKIWLCVIDLFIEKLSWNLAKIVQETTKLWQF